MRLHAVILLSTLSMGLALQAHALAPVVDDSENFATFDEQTREPVLKKQPPAVALNEEEPLAKEMPEDKTQQLSLQAQVRALQQEVQSLRGELEVQAHLIEELKQQQITLYKDMDARLRGNVKNEAPKPIDMTSPLATKTNSTAEEALAKPSVAQLPPKEVTSSQKEVITTPPPTSTKNPADEQIAYLAAYDLVKAKRYDEALTAMQAFIKQYPQGGYTANAEYWTGELYLTRNLPAQAIVHFETVINQFPRSSKAAASALKIGYALSAMGQREEAKMRLKEVIKNYPDTAAAQLAKSKLEDLSSP